MKNIHLFILSSFWFSYSLLADVADISEIYYINAEGRYYILLCFVSFLLFIFWILSMVTVDLTETIMKKKYNTLHPQ